MSLKAGSPMNAANAWIYGESIIAAFWVFRASGLKNVLKEGMKHMIDAQAYMMRVQLYDANIENMLEELQRLNDFVLKITATMGGEVVSGTRAQDRLGDAVSKLVDYSDEIKESISQYKEKKQAISATVQKIENADQVKVLHKLYFECKQWKVIAKEMHMTVRNAQYIHDDALVSVERILRKEKE